jgi:hypothetical protein
MDVRERVFAECDRFYAALPRLLESPLKGRWVVFLNGEVQADFENQFDAYHAAGARFGYDGGFVIARVEPQRVIWVPGSQLLE